MMFHKNLSELGWEKVKMKQLHRLTLVDEWIELIQMKSGHSVLDIGPGPGVFTQRYAKVVGSTGKVTTLEKSEEAIAHLTEELKQPVNGIERRNHRYKDHCSSQPNNPGNSCHHIR